MKTDVYTVLGKKAGEIELPENVFGVAWNDSLMYQVVRAMQMNARTPVAHTKDRGDVRGGGKKPWRQKGTGRARHGSIRSPIWRGGGVTHGPRNEKNYERSIPKKMRAKALMMALSRKLADGEVLFVDSFGFDAPKTAAAKKALTALTGVKGFEQLATKRKNAAIIALSERAPSVEKSFRNIGSVSIERTGDLNPVAILAHKYIILENPNAALAALAGRVAKKTRKTAAK